MNYQVVRRITAALFAAQSLASLGMSASLTVGTIAAAYLSGQPALAGLPSTLYLLGSALGAYPAGRLMDRFGRRPGLAAGFVTGLAGALLAAAAMPTHLFALLLLGYVLMGLSRGAVDQGRYAAAEVVRPEERGRAISRVVLGGTVGAIGGPLVIGPAGSLAARFHQHEVTGPFLAAGLLFLAGSLVVLALLRPDPRDVGRALVRLAAPAGAGGEPAARRSFAEILRLRPAQLALMAMVSGQVVMVVLMVITPLEMTNHHHGLDAVSWVIAAHVAGMYALSVASGRVADLYGRETAVRMGALLLLTACVLAPLAGSAAILALALFVLGLGWNFCYVAGSSLLSDLLRPAERGRIQGTSDLMVGLTAAAGSLGSGLLFAAVGYAGIAVVGGGLAIMLLAVATLLSGVVARRPEMAEP